MACPSCGIQGRPGKHWDEPGPEGGMPGCGALAVPFPPRHRGSRQGTRSPCSGIPCARCGWSSTCSWPNSRPGWKGKGDKGCSCPPESWERGRIPAWAWQTPTHLDQLVPAARDDDGVAAVGGEANAGHPFRVALILGKQQRDWEQGEDTRIAPPPPRHSGGAAGSEPALHGIPPIPPNPQGRADSH